MADIILKNQSGTDVTYTGVDKITVPKSGGGTQEFSISSSEEDSKYFILVQTPKVDVFTQSGRDATYTLDISSLGLSDIVIVEKYVGCYRRYGTSIYMLFNASSPDATISGNTMTVSATLPTDTSSLTYSWTQQDSSTGYAYGYVVLKGTISANKIKCDGNTTVSSVNTQLISSVGSGTNISSIFYYNVNVLHDYKVNTNITTSSSYGADWLRSYAVQAKSITFDTEVTAIPQLSYIVGDALLGDHGKKAYNLTSIHFKSTTPPAISSASYLTNYITTDCKIYVPSGTLSTYTSATNYPPASTYTYIEE